VLPDPDPQVLRRFQEGDPSAFESLVRRYEGAVLSLARRYLGSRSPGVEDVAQAVFVRIWRSRATYEPRAKVGTWIFRITVNACLNEIRRLRADKNRRVSSFSAVFGSTGGDPPSDGGTADVVVDERSPAPPDSVEAGETAARVRAAVDALPEQQRLALILSRYHGCSYEDVAAAMESSVPAVKSLLVRARENLRRTLAPSSGRPAPARRTSFDE
jgi:RNA polymerase sigma-70 factor, ECF subfamily